MNLLYNLQCEYSLVIFYKTILSMKLKILTWNLNFFYDNWYDRIKSINKVLEKEIENNDIIVLQEATIPLLKSIDTIFGCLKSPLISYTPHYTFSDEIKTVFDKITTHFPKKKQQLTYVLKFIMDKIFGIVSWAFYNFGSSFQYLYFNYPLVWGCLFMTLLPLIFVCGYCFLGMMCVVNKNKIKTVVKSKFVGRPFQYCQFEFNNKKVLLCNIHLNEASDTKGFIELKKIISFTSEIPHDILILAGDFNSSPTSNVYKYLTKNGFKSAIKEKHEKDIKTWPAINPKTCIDYIWIKGKDVKICSANIFGNALNTDHKGVKCCLDII
tara:strand:- start:273 stop:1247 length:975 start_codon:yes stop_codon:yes gene_type:complete